MPRVAVLSFGVADAPLSRDGQAAFEAGLRQLGWTPGTTVAVEYRWEDNDHDRLAPHIAVAALDKRIELLKEAVPNLRRVFVLAAPTSFGVTPEVNRAGRALGLEVQQLAVGTPEELSQAFSIMRQNRTAGIVVHADSGGPLDREVARIVSMAASHRLPAHLCVAPARGGWWSHGLRRRSR